MFKPFLHPYPQQAFAPKGILLISNCIKWAAAGNGLNSFWNKYLIIFNCPVDYSHMCYMFYFIGWYLFVSF